MAVIGRNNSKYWYVVYRHGGKQIWFSTKTEDKLLAERLDLEIRSGIRNNVDKKRLTELIEKLTGQELPKTGTSVSGAWDVFLQQPGQNQRKKRTIVFKKQIWEGFIRWMKVSHPEIGFINDVDRNVAMAYARHIQQEGKSPQTYNNHRHNIRGIFKGLMFVTGMKENPFDVVPTLSARHVSYRRFTLDEIKKILKKAKSHWKLAVYLGLYTGLRFKDVCMLKWKSIDLANNRIIAEPAKTERFGKKVVIPIHPALLKILSGIKNRKEYLLPEMAVRYDRRRFKNEFPALLRICKIKDNDDGIAGFHSLRHTFVTLLEEGGTERHVSQKLVGHGSPITTEIYSHDIKSLEKGINTLPVLKF